MYTPINNPQGGGEDIYSFPAMKKFLLIVDGLLLKSSIQEYLKSNLQ